MKIASLRATHRTVALEDLEPLAHLIPEQVARELAREPAVAEVVVLSTCNRFEIYLAAPDPPAAHGAAFTLLSRLLPAGLPKGFEVERGLDSAEHLFRVAAGLESLIVGEDQILGQVREAFKVAQDAGTVGPSLTLLFERALAAGKKARARTRINRGAVSVGSAAVDLSAELLGGLAGRRVLLVGTGEMAGLVVRSLAGRGASLTVVAHSDLERARKLAAPLGGQGVPFEELAARVAESDVVVAATAAPEPVLARADVAPLAHPILLIDVANPRNVAPECAELPHVRLVDLEGLKRVADVNLRQRRSEAEAAAHLVRAEVARLAEHAESRAALDAVARLQTRARAIREEELAKAKRRLQLTPAQSKLVENLVGAVAKRLLAPPTEALRAAGRRGDEATLAAARVLLGLESEPTQPRCTTARRRLRRGG